MSGRRDHRAASSVPRRGESIRRTPGLSLSCSRRCSRRAGRSPRTTGRCRRLGRNRGRSGRTGPRPSRGVQEVHRSLIWESAADRSHSASTIQLPDGARTILRVGRCLFDPSLSVGNLRDERALPLVVQLRPLHSVGARRPSAISPRPLEQEGCVAAWCVALLGVLVCGWCWGVDVVGGCVGGEGGVGEGLVAGEG